MGSSFASDKILIFLILISIFPVFKSLFSVPFSLPTTLPETLITDSDLRFSSILKYLLLFSMTHWVTPK